MGTDPRRLGIGQRGHALLPGRAARSSMRPNSTRSGKRRSRSMIPIRTGSSAVRPKGTAPTPSPSMTRSISPSQNGQHLLDVGEDLARTPRRFGSGAVVLGQRPRLAGHHPGCQIGVCRVGPRRCVRRHCSCQPVWHARRTMDALMDASARAQARAGAGPACSGERAMTETLPRGAANQAGARVDADAYAKAADFLPLDGIDHVEFWVGNARQASAYYRALWGFTPVAFSGLETKVRDRASYVMVQNDIRFVFTAPLTPDGEIAEHVRAHGDGVHDIASASPTSSRPGARRRRAALRRRWSRPSSMAARTACCASPRSGRTARRSTRSSTDATTTAAFAPGYRKVAVAAAGRRWAQPARGRPLRRQCRARPDGRLRRLLPRRARVSPS